MHKSFYYFDASVRIQSKLEHLSGVQKREIPPVMLFDETKHSVWATVHPGLFENFLIFLIKLTFNKFFEK